MTPLERQQRLATRVRSARVDARKARALAILAWWPASWLLAACAWAVAVWAGHLEGQQVAARQKVRAELERLDQAHRAGRRTMNRRTGAR